MTASGTAESKKAEVEQLMLLYQRGDAAAAASLVRAVSPGFARFCLSQGDSPQDLEDILQEIWLRVHRARHTYTPGLPATAWLYAIARHARLDARRRRVRFRARELQMDPLPEVSDKPGFESAPVADMLACLPAGQREVLVMLKGCGMTLDEVARATSSTVGAVKQKAHRAYERLRVAIGKAAGGRR
jgi:RNA polymerase sigma-70 factor, ECF subfamily